MERARTLIAWAGLVVFGLPALLAVPALLSTVSQFGIWATLTQALPLAALTCVPLLLWIRYIRHRPHTKRGTVAWCLVVAVALAALLASSLWFWAGPILLVLILEIASNLARRVLVRRGRLGAPASGPVTVATSEVARRSAAAS